MKRTPLARASLIEDANGPVAPREKPAAPKRQVTPDPARKLQPMELKVWTRVSGIKADQLAGFVAFAQLQDLGPRTAPD